jgi:hypothetical protein
MSEKLTESEESELAALEAKLQTTPAEMSVEENGRHIELLCKQSEAEEEEEMEEFEATLGVEPQETVDPTIKTLVSASGTITRYRIVEGKKQIIDELRPIPFRKALRGGRFLEPVIVPGVGTLLMTPDFQKRVLAQEPEATAEAAKFGIEAVVKFFRRFTPDRRKQAANPGSQAVPQGSAAEAVSEMQAATALGEQRRRLTKAAIRLTPTTGEQRDELAKTLGVADPRVKLSPEEIAARQAHHDKELENAGRASEPLQFDGPVLPTETA